MGVDVEVVLVTGPPMEPGEVGAFEQLYRAEHARLVAVALTFLRDREAALDAVQETFVRTYQNWPDVRELGRPAAWARRVLVNICIDAIRRSKREAASNRRFETLPQASTASQVVDPTAEVFRAASSLPRLQLAVVALHHVDGMSIAEVADVLGVRPGTVKTSLFRARRRLAKVLEAQP
jgi:RNA polymerase sigma-70 factor, ECF subfamily